MSYLDGTIHEEDLNMHPHDKPEPDKPDPIHIPCGQMIEKLEGEVSVRDKRIVVRDKRIENLGKRLDEAYEKIRRLENPTIS